MDDNNNAFFKKSCFKYSLNNDRACGENQGCPVSLGMVKGLQRRR